MPLQSNSDPMTSSTQGSTLVRMATITAVGSALVADDERAAAAEVVAGKAGAPQSGRTVTELQLCFDDGASVTYRIEPGVIFQPGERVKVITRSGKTRITH